MTGGDLFTGANYATLMRIVCQRNGGTFVALPVIRDGERRTICCARRRRRRGDLEV